MIIFYTQNKDVKKLTPIIPIQPKVVAKVLTATSCSSVCSSSCIKPKTRCCNKYQKKGINCKRCPLTFDIKIAS
ncbi:hypothetical protein [Tenacibaculum finnmarkense]|uniref:hypothetical protein n=1 Tax=Tenacibaculum finnmarkense TaxID=2781243 RepID=UPI0013566F2D|nr:hypothetical protein [Tenacibaculum finnmarkense]MCD8439865.1 hypothetical protein [Tenacibaculum finnmarkense genomovar ulcerans]MCG8245723.1 hypothetical protein [Tenacibaculum finnmarkense genomovar finnmarkense]MCG8720824.1 hypothetical protein [Tenacibaculum finnmarkense]MCG8752172.1 hypothetical protein [Tenacibaculum finnmarkense]MCG8756533.1 hypothetical protein [Tenacibaculum finnmarkense]